MGLCPPTSPSLSPSPPELAALFSPQPGKKHSPVKNLTPAHRGPSSKSLGGAPKTPSLARRTQRSAHIPHSLAPRCGSV